MQSNRSKRPISAGAVHTMSWLGNSQSMPLSNTSTNRLPMLIENSNVAYNNFQPFQFQPSLPPLHPGRPAQTVPLSCAVTAGTNHAGLNCCTQQPPTGYMLASVPTTLQPAAAHCLAAADTTTMQINERGEVEQVVVKDGQVFHISYVEEPWPVESTTGSGVSDTLPSIENELSELLDKSTRPESAIPANELEETYVRDWINYDELPLLSQHKQLVSTCMDQISPPVVASREKPTCEKCQHSKTVSQEPRKKANCGCKMRLASSDTGQHGRMPNFTNYCVECVIFFPSVQALQAHMELEHRLIDDACDKLVGRDNTFVPHKTFAGSRAEATSSSFALGAGVYQHNCQAHASDRSSCG